MDPLTNARVSMVVKVPKRLIRWWNMFTWFEQNQIKSRLGTLISLMHMVPRPDLVEALSTFWDPQCRVFRFGEHELMPTLTEIAGLTRLPYLDKDLIYPRAHSSKRFFKDLGMKHDEHLGCFEESWVPMDFLFERFARPTGYETFVSEFSMTYESWQKKRPMIFAIALLGILVFPLEDRHISTRLGSVAFALFHDEKGSTVTLVPMILAEIYRALTGIREGKRFFEGCNLLLQLWMIEHLHPPSLLEKDIVDRCIWDRVTCIEHRMRFEKFALPIGVDAWVEYLGSLSEEQILWSYFWIPQDTILTRCDVQPFLILIGLWCIRPYTPARVMRQLGRQQDIPFVPDVRSYILDWETNIPRENDIRTYWQCATKMGKSTLAANPRSPGCTHEYSIWIQSLDRGISRPLPHRTRGVFDEEATSRILLRQLIDRFRQVEESHSVDKEKARASFESLRSQLTGLARNIGEHRDYISRVSLPDAGTHALTLLPSIEVSLQGIIEGLDLLGITVAAHSGPSQPGSSHSGPSQTDSL